MDYNLKFLNSAVNICTLMHINGYSSVTLFTLHCFGIITLSFFWWGRLEGKAIAREELLPGTVQ